MTVAAHCEREVRELHAFFEAWFNGDVPATDETFARLAGVLAEEFILVSPAGRPISRPQVLALVRQNHPLNKTPGSTAEVEIRIEEFSTHIATADFILVTYQEWQSRGGPARGRQSSAIFRVSETTPNGLEWLHLHETWIETT